MEIADALARARAQGDTVVLVTVSGAVGVDTVAVGAQAVVASGDESGEVPGGVVAGTLGSTDLDAAAEELAVELLEQVAVAEEPALRRQIPLPGAGPEAAVELVAEIREPGPGVLVLGASPLGRALVRLVRVVGWWAVVVAPGGDTDVPGGVEVRADEPPRLLLAAPPGPRDAVVVADPAASWVEESLRVALASAAGYVGLCGDADVAARVVRRLRDAGVSDQRLRRLVAPAGVDVGGEQVGEEALAVLAEAVAAITGGTLSPRSQRWSPQ